MAATTNTTRPTPHDQTKKSRPIRARKVETVSTEALLPAEPASAEPVEVPAVPTPEPDPAVTPTPAEAETVRKDEPTPDQGQKVNKLSALDAAIRVLAETGQAMTCSELIAAMAAQGYWTSPRGRTPQATLYASFLRELQARGEKARVVKTSPGKFAVRGPV
jgi:hypothetical protein